MGQHPGSGYLGGVLSSPGRERSNACPGVVEGVICEKRRAFGRGVDYCTVTNGVIS